MSGRWVLAAGLATLGSCTGYRPIPPDHPCREAAYAIAARTEECTGDVPLALDRFEAFEDTYVCLAVEVGDGSDLIAPEDLYDCAWAIRELPCELVDTYGDDLDRYLALSDACTWIVARRDGKALPAGPSEGGSP